ncbi:GH92 family glycosyl hydrolase [Brachybacterium sp. J144]|uniref:GH92 family glycosyl hydrolase n=1 Tax=Brachybacterium sp. J144 TaxID=3116487 RepID=UPI002E789A72|nr:GH92 family glycosyl hydrolase [Brachybacterium sp. J144]MEE1652042.1 GH92 family glycosyl hydrolase [Brachybacterium sp. J144]
MIVTADPGPVGSPTSRDGAGFLSPETLMYVIEPGERAEVAVDGHEGAPSLVGRTIGAGEQLRWFLHPVLDPALSWGATHATIDLEFTDGSRLSQLDPRDQYGTEATADGIGAARILYADQWNDVQVGLDAAVGRTIARVLLVAAAPVTDDQGEEIGAGVELHGFLDGPYLAPRPADPPLEDPVAWVDTRRGTYASGDFSRGNTLPLTAVPNGFAFFTPVTDARTRRWLYEYHRRNGADNRPRLQGVAISHQPSPWMGDRNQFVMMPLLGEEPDASPEGRALTFDHATETARPDLYEAPLAGGTTVRLAPTDHGAVLEIDLPTEPGERHLLLEGVDRHCRIDAAGAVLDGRFHAWVDSGLAEGYARADGATRMFVLGEVSPAPVAVGPADGASPGAALLSFEPGTTRVTVRLVTSFLGLEQARRTFAREVERRTLEQVRREAHAAWAERLEVVHAPGATPAERRTLYGNLYRLNLYPNSHWEDAGTAQRPEPVHASPVLPVKGEATDTRTNAQVIPGRLYVNNGFWDTYRTAWPAYALLYPELAAELADGFVQQFREGGWIARWSSPGYADCMTGTSSDIAFADLLVKGIELPDPEAAYLSGLRNATVAPPFPEVGRKGNERAVFTGYVDTDTPESVSWSLEAHINDAGLAVHAELLAERTEDPARAATLREEAAYLRERSMGYALLFDPAVRFFQGRRRDGSFSATPEEFDPLSWGGDFTETDGWNFAFHVPHDGEGLADLYGGRDALHAQLEEFFATPERADRKGTYGHVIHEMTEARAVRMGQFGVSNQPAHHIPFLFHHAGSPHRAAEVVREVQRRLFVGEQIGQGYPGDEDNGEMSAWWLLTALGLYPLQLATERYHLVAPLFEEAHVRPLGGEPFTVYAPAARSGEVALTGVTADGAALPGPWIEHSALRGRIEVAVGEEPDGFDAVPPSLTPPGGRAHPLVDLLPRVASDPLLDDDSGTERRWEERTALIDLPVLEEALTARYLTLTSGAEEGGDPIAWRLEGSRDGRTWEVLDARSGETFRWRRQTRPFRLAAPQAMDHHRLVITAAQGPLSLAQVELLA